MHNLPPCTATLENNGKMVSVLQGKESGLKANYERFSNVMVVVPRKKNVNI